MTVIYWLTLISFGVSLLYVGVQICILRGWFLGKPQKNNSQGQDVHLADPHQRCGVVTTVGRKTEATGHRGGGPSDSEPRNIAAPMDCFSSKQSMGEMPKNNNNTSSASQVTLQSGTESEVPIISVIVAARDEEMNIGACLKSLSGQDVPLDDFEVIVVNDHSTDATVEMAQSSTIPNLRVYNLPSGQEGKKAAIRYGIAQSKGDFLLFTDADCEAPPTWIRSVMGHMIDESLDGLCSSISMKAERRSLVGRFQMLDNIGMMAVSAAAVNGRFFSMANGANLAVRRSILSKNKIDWHEQFASGDDMALIDHVRKAGGHVKFVHDPCTIVKTGTISGWTTFFYQRIRWGTKNKSSGQKGLVTVAGIVYLAALSHVFSWVVLGLHGAGYLAEVPDLIWVVILLKPLIDTFVLSTLRPFFDVRMSVFSIPFFSIMHSLYIFTVGSLSLVWGRYSWKGRRVS